jgi:hypothetical protein
MNHFFEESLVAEHQRALREKADIDRLVNGRREPSRCQRLGDWLRCLAGRLPAPTDAPGVERSIQPTTPGH